MSEIDPAGNDSAETPVVPAPRSKPKTKAGLFILGFLAALVLYGALAFVVFQLYTPTGSLGGILSSSVLILVDFAVFVTMLRSGRTSGKAALASFGKGGVWACIAVPLLTLLAFGTCTLLIPQN